MPHCDSPGCTQKDAPRPITDSCYSPGCPGRAICHAKRNTQAYAPAPDPKPVKGPLARPSTGENFCRTLCVYSCKVGIADYALVAVLYPEVAKYGGLKLMIFQTAKWNALKNKDRCAIDPHFYPDAKSCLARFRPDWEGLNAAATTMRLDLLGSEMTPFRAILATVTAMNENAQTP